MTRPLLVDLYCGGGGASVGYHRAGFDIIGIDQHPQPHYPFPFTQADALAAPIDWSTVAAVHASPPCESFTAYRRKDPDSIGADALDLVAPTRDLLHSTGLPYVIENVVGAPLHDPVMLCGSSFHLDVRRHRLFESNMLLLGLPCDHDWQTPRFPPATNRTNLRSTVEIGVYRIPEPQQQAAMGIDWLPREILTKAIPPAYTEHLGHQLLAYV